jgi:hypothetical protein
MKKCQAVEKELRRSISFVGPDWVRMRASISIPCQ